MSVALVTGGSGGLGQAIALKLAQVGHDLVLSYRRNAAAAEACATRIRELGRSARVVALDLNDVAAVSEIVSEIEGLSTVVHAVGSDIPMQYVSQITSETWQRVLHADVDGFFHVVRAALPLLPRNQWLDRRDHQRRVVSASRARCALRRAQGCDRSARQSRRARGRPLRSTRKLHGRGRGGTRRVPALRGAELPTAVDRERARRRTHPLGLFGSAEDVAEAVALSRPSKHSAGYVTGQTIVVVAAAACRQNLRTSRCVPAPARAIWRAALAEEHAAQSCSSTPRQP